MKLRFTTRDLLWLVIVAVLAVGWWIDRTQIITHLKRNSSRQTFATLSDLPPPAQKNSR